MNDERMQKRKNFIINTAFLAVVLLLGYFALEYALVWVMPFLLGFLVALALRPVIRFLHNKWKLNKRVGSFIVLLLGYVLVGLLVWWIGSALASGIKDFCMNLPTLFTEKIAPFFNDAGVGILGFVQWVAPDMAGEIEAVLAASLEDMQSSLIGLSTDVVTALAGASTKLPLWLISFIFTILSSLYISMDYDHVMEFIVRQLPAKTRDFLVDIRGYLGKTILGYLRAYLILMVITFLEVSVGLLILRVENPFGIGAVVAVADAFPVLGTGTIVIPWAIISLFQKRFYLALGLMILYLIVTVVRHFIEPKIVGDQLGIPPIVAIICIYLGFVWFGVLGAIGFPVIMNIIFSLHKAGKIHIWK